MIIRVRYALGLLRDILAFAKSSGQWWLPVVVVLMAIAGVLALTAKVVVPSAVYVLF